jgi:hypothetical protein|tara:strand:- start:426 stop:536 length:111 start_codon:yes stop_codon:yes gene_type:complete
MSKKKEAARARFAAAEIRFQVKKKNQKVYKIYLVSG